MTLTIGTTGRLEPGSSVSYSYATLTTPPESGVVHRRNARPQQRRVWDVTFKYLDQSELDTIYNEFVAAKGSCGIISFVPPRETYTISARFAESRLSPEKLGPKHYKLSIRIQEDVRV